MAINNYHLLNFTLFMVGMEKEFYSFHDHCFESKQNKYTTSSIYSFVLR